LGAVAYPLAALTAVVLPLTNDMSTVITLFGLLIFTQAVDVRWAFVGVQRTVPVAIASVVGAVIYLVAVVALVNDSSDVVVVAIVHVGAQAMVSAVLLVVSRRTFGRWRPHLRRGVGQRSILLESTPLTIASVARAATVSVDVILVKAIRPANEAGEYAAASRLMTVGLVYLGLYYGTLFPLLVRAARHGHSELRALVQASARRAAVVGAVLAVGCVLLIPTVVPAVFGDDYQGTVGLLQVLIAALFLIGLSGLVNNSLVALGRERTFSQIMGMGLAVNLLANLVLLPTVGTVGAAIATVVTEVAILVVGFAFLWSALATESHRVAEVGE
jgi:O-antigen/teichoic acid export membrane protein